MDESQFPFATVVDWALPPLPRPNGLKTGSDKKLCLHVVLGQSDLGDYTCFEPTSARAGYFGRLGLSVAEGNYIDLAAEMAGTKAFADGTPMVPFDRLPAPIRAHFEAGGRLFWSRAYGVTLTREWRPLHVETGLQPGADPVMQRISQQEGVALSRYDTAARIATWERLRDLTADKDGPHLLDLEEMGADLERVFRAAEMNATGHMSEDRIEVCLRPAAARSFDRGFAVPLTATGPMDETYAQLREIIGFHQIWYVSAMPFDLQSGVEQAGVMALTLPLYAGAMGQCEIVNDTDVFEVRHFAPA